MTGGHASYKQVSDCEYGTKESLKQKFGLLKDIYIDNIHVILLSVQ